MSFFTKSNFEKAFSALQSVQKDDLITLINENPELLDEKDKHGTSIFDYTIQRITSLKLKEFFFKPVLDVMLERRPKTINPVYIQKACYNGHVSFMQYLFDKDMFDVNAKIPVYGTPLHAACHGTEIGAVRWLLSKGANPKTLDERGLLPQEKTSSEQIQRLLIQATPSPAPKAPPPKKQNAQETTDTWKVYNLSVIHISRFPVVGHVLTDIFNFETQERVHIHQNKNGHETVFPPQPFEAANINAINAAARHFKHITGKAPPEYNTVRKMPLKQIPQNKVGSS